MKLVYQILLDILFPRTSYERWLACIPKQFVHKYCAPGSLTGLPLGIRPLFAYKDQHISALIHQMKFFKDQAAVSLIAQLICEAISQEYADQDAKPYIVITWIPARRRRLKQYGYCQGQLLANTIASRLVTQGLNVSPAQFLRRHFTFFSSEQKLLSRHRRLTRKNPFVYRKRRSIIPNQPTHIWIIDDVVTTGFTLDMARETLYQNIPAKTPIMIRCLAFAH